MASSIKVLMTFFILTQALFFQVDLPQLVLCFGDDGHIALENSDGVACGHPENLLAKAVKKLQSISGRHDDCKDVILDWHFSNADLTKIKNSIPKVSSHFAQFFPSENKTNTISFIKKIFLIENNTTIDSIHTTVLLI
jgi:hypothetical protein